MTELPSMENRLAALDARLKSLARQDILAGGRTGNFVTLSRQTGAGGASVGRLLIALLNAAEAPGSPAWLFLDKELIGRALEHQNLPLRLAGYLPEDQTSEIRAVIGELVGLHPPLWDLHAKVAESMLQFAHMGHVVLAGRGANFVTGKLRGGLHVRLVGSLERRAARIAALLHIGPEAAEGHCLKTDLARKRFVRSHYGQDVEDPQHYDLVLNTDTLPLTSVARILVAALKERGA